MNREEAMAQAAKMVSDPEMQAEIAECLLAPVEPPLDNTDIEPKFAPLVAWLIIWHTTVAQWRLASRRFYVWRDRPTWVVRFMVDIFRPQDRFDEELVSQARAEMETRRTNAARGAPRA